MPGRAELDGTSAEEYRCGGGSASSCVHALVEGPEVASLLPGEHRSKLRRPWRQERRPLPRAAVAVSSTLAAALLAGAVTSAVSAARGAAGPRHVSHVGRAERKDELYASPVTSFQQQLVLPDAAAAGAYAAGGVSDTAGVAAAASSNPGATTLGEAAIAAPSPGAWAGATGDPSAAPEYGQATADLAPSPGAVQAPSPGAVQAPSPGWGAGEGGAAEEQQWATPAPVPCGWVEENTYYPGNDLDVPLYGVLTAEDCCAKCATNSSCYAWTYKKDTQECALKGNKPLEALTKITDPEYTSGQPTHVRTAIPLTVPEPGQNTLYCWALMIPGSMEPMLLAWEFENAQSFFRCDEYAVFSNQTLTVVPGLVSKTVASDLHCEKGGEFGTALNTEIFITVWTAVVADGRYKFHDWTVKADPDSVFFPSRLRTILAKYNEDVKSAPNGVYLNNCHRGMHGPIEVISKKAVQVWVEGIPSCQSHFVQLCQGDCQWGEDMFMDQCLDKVLKVDRKNNSKLLVEEACDPPKGWESCKDEHIAAYHPFKEVGAYKTCLVSSGITGLA